MHPSLSLVSRREFLALAGIGAASYLAATRSGSSQGTKRPRLTVLAPLPPNPAPPGVVAYIEDGLPLWEEQHKVDVFYDATAVENMKAKILINIRQGYYVHDLMYCGGWAPEITSRLLAVDPLLGPQTRNDLPPSALTSFQWENKLYGVPAVSNPMILFGNENLLGSSAAPQTWDDLLAIARAGKSVTTAGWVLPAGQSGGSGGLMASWQVFFLQAGGRLFDARGKPAIANDAGVAAIDMLQQLLPYTLGDPFAIKSLQDATVAFLQGKTALMMNWATMHTAMVDPQIALIPFPIRTDPLPAGPVGRASIDSGDGWTIDNRSWQPGRAMDLIQFLLQPQIQVQMYLATGWLPISKAALADPELRKVAPHAGTVAEQMRFRIDSGLRPNTDVVAQVIGGAVQRALLGQEKPLAALRAATTLLTSAGTEGKIFA